MIPPNKYHTKRVSKIKFTRTLPVPDPLKSMRQIIAVQDKLIESLEKHIELLKQKP